MLAFIFSSPRPLLLEYPQFNVLSSHVHHDSNLKGVLQLGIIVIEMRCIIVKLKLEGSDQI